MGLLTRFDPPAFLTDFLAIPGQLDAWHHAVSGWFDASIQMDRGLVQGNAFQFFNPATFDPGGTFIEQTIGWNAFPKELIRRFGRERALREADTLWTLDRYWSDLQGREVSAAKFPVLFRTLFRPQNEYCEWYVTRDPSTNDIVRATFVSEPPEYWFALSGYSVPGDSATFPGDPALLVKLYSDLTGHPAALADLIATEDIDSPSGLLVAKGGYNPYNRWNTTHGIVHLSAPPNSLTAEIQLGADATILRTNAAGKLLVEPDALICCAAYGGPDRNSDPTIGASVNALARLGAFITLPNPVGLYMDHLDLAGWAAPDGKEVVDCLRIVRGTAGMIERLVVEVPAQRGFCVSDLLIGGEPIRFGGQIAECITVKLIGLACIQSSPVVIPPVPCAAQCCLDSAYPTGLRRPVRIGSDLPVGTVPALIGQGATEAPAAGSPPAKPRRGTRGPKLASPRLRTRVDP